MSSLVTHQTSVTSTDPLERIWPRALAAPVPDPLSDALLTQHVASPLWELMDRGGRRWRPVIVRLCFEAAGGRAGVPEALFQVVELLHHGSLVVDDIEDDASQRRNGPAVHLAHGVPHAINAANAGYFRALAMLKELLPDTLRLRALDMLVEELWHAHLGQALDLSLGQAMAEGAVVGTVHYRKAAEAKTGALVRMAARLGAIAAGASAETEQALASWATQFGLAYQMTDDAEDLVEDVLRPGACRLSYPVLLALDRCSPPDRAELRQILGLEAAAPREDASARLLQLVTDCGALAQARQDARALACSALDSIASLPRSRPLQELTHTWLLGKTT